MMEVETQGYLRTLTMKDKLSPFLLRGVARHRFVSAKALQQVAGNRLRTIMAVYLYGLLGAK